MQLRLPTIPTHPQSGSAPTTFRPILMLVAASWEVFGPSEFAESVCVASWSLTKEPYACLNQVWLVKSWKLYCKFHSEVPSSLTQNPALTLLSDVFGGLCNKENHDNFIMLNRKDFSQDEIPAARGRKKREKRSDKKTITGRLL